MKILVVPMVIEFCIFVRTADDDEESRRHRPSERRQHRDHRKFRAKQFLGSFNAFFFSWKNSQSPKIKIKTHTTMHKLTNQTEQK